MDLDHPPLFDTRRLLSAALFAALFVALLLLVACDRSDPAGDTAPDSAPETVAEFVPPGPGTPVIVIDIDTLRADHLGCYGYPRDTSPNIDTMSREGVRFDWVFSQAPKYAALPGLDSHLSLSQHPRADPR